MPPLEFTVDGLDDSLALWHGEASTVFWSKGTAEEAIQTSRRYATKTASGYKLRSFSIVQIEITAEPAAAEVQA